jgi:hypothetical protein
MRKEEGKKIKDTKVGKWITNNLPDIADKVGDFLPDRGLLGVVKKVVDNDPNLTSEQISEFNRILVEYEINNQEQITRRWEADASGDVKIAKYIRPSVLIVLTAFYMIITVWDGLDDTFTPSENYVDLLEVLMLTVFGAYFAGRTIEKIRR